MTVQLDYRYCEFHKSAARNYVYYYARNPESGLLDRKRIYLDHIKTAKNRDRYAKKLMQEINNKLDMGWNPFLDDTENKRKYTTIEEALNFAYNYKLKYIRKRSIPNYRQRIKVLKEWLKEKGILTSYIFEFKDNTAINYMNELLMTKKMSKRTWNNYLNDYRSFFNLLVKNKYLNGNPFRAVDKLPTEDVTSKRPFHDNELKLYIDYVKKYDYDFYIISMYTYYCAIRPAEICKLKIRNINLDKGFIHIPANISKNKREAVIPIASKFLNILKDYYKDPWADILICSRKFKPGSKILHPNKIAMHFRKIANHLNLSSEVKFYALKDTAAEKLLQAGFSTKVIRDLFRHSNISMTDNYLKRFNVEIDNRLRNDFPEL